MNIVFFGTSNVALPILEKLYQHHHILAVVTQPDARVGRSQEVRESPVAVLAKEMDALVSKPEEVKNNPQFIEQLQSLAADIFVVVSYGKILPAEIINLPPLKTLNAHFSLLPKYRGASPIQFALLNGDAVTGATIFVLDEKMDSGPIVAQKDMAIDADDNFFSLSQKLAYESAKLLIETLPQYQSGQIKPVEQNHELATYTKIITRDDAKIDWTKSAAEIYNQFRAFFPWPGIWTKWGGKLVKILDCIPVGADIIRPKSEAADGRPCAVGTILDGGVVVCGPASPADRQNTFLQIKSLLLEGKKETSITDFLNGYKDFVGVKLG